MATRLNVEGSHGITDPMLLSFHKQGEAACLILQKHLDEGFYSLTEAITKIDRFTERVRNAAKAYQSEKNLLFSINTLYGQQEEFLEEYQGYKTTHLKAVILIENTQKTIQLIQPTRRSRSDEKSFQENLPAYYAELKQSEETFSRYADQLKKTQSIISSLKHRLHAAIDSKTLKVALEKFRHIVENQGSSRSKPTRLLGHFSSHSQPPIILEPIHLTAKRPSVSPLHEEKKTRPPFSRASIHKLSSTSSEPISLGRRVSNSNDPIPAIFQRTRHALSDRESISPRANIRLSPPQKRAETLSPRNATLQLRNRDLSRSTSRELFTHLMSSEESSPYRRRFPRSQNPGAIPSPRNRYTKLSGSAEPIPSYQIQRNLTPWHRKTYEQDTSSLELERGRKIHAPALNHVRY